MAFGQRAQNSAPAPAQINAGPKEDHYADVTEMVSPKGAKSKYVKFVQDVSGDNGLYIPKGTIFAFETFDEIYNRVPNPSQKMLDWLTARTTPHTTEKGAVLTGFGQIKKPFTPS